MSNANKPAFPSEPRSFAPPDSFGSGLSKREYFAAVALQGLLASGAGGDKALKVLAAVDYADVLLAQLENTKESA